MAFQYSSNSQDFLLQQIEQFFKSLQSLLVGIGKNEGKAPMAYFDSLYEEHLHANRDFFVDSDFDAITKHLEEKGLPNGLELVARLLYETGNISDNTIEYHQKALGLYEEHLKKGHSISLENIGILVMLREAMA